MTREELTKSVVECNKKCIVIEAATSVGKSLIAIKKVANLLKGKKKSSKVLIVIPRLVLIENWKTEFKKFHYDGLLENVIFTTYASLHKHAGKWSVVIFDEGHHTSERCQEILEGYNIDNILVLSATIKRETKYFFKLYSKYNYQEFRVNIQQAIEEDILPDPKIILIEQHIDKVQGYYDYIINPKSTRVDKTIYKLTKDNYWVLKRNNKNIRTTLRGTASDYLKLLDYLVDFYKRKSSRPAMKNLWLFTAGERLKWLAGLKQEVMLKLLAMLKDKRKLVFCESINGSEKLDIPSVNSKVGTDNIDKFNKGKINSLSCVEMLTEGISLVNCQVGIFQMINSSLRLQAQKFGKQ